jgi:hypothetical protein
MGHPIEVEAANIVGPLKNTTGMKAIANVLSTPATQTLNLATIFGRMNAGHFLTIAADGSKCYIAFASNDQGTLDETAVGVGPTVCYPIPDGQSIPTRMPIGGRELATGYATLASYTYLHYKSIATCNLRLWRSSLSQAQDAANFPPPGMP